MATMITEECINCGACEPECPNEAISSIGDLFVIDPVLCTECVGFHDVEQCAAVCPVDCCVEDPNNPEPESLLVDRARAIHPDAQIGEDFPSRFRTGDAGTPAKAPVAAAVPAAAEASGGAAKPAVPAAAEASGGAAKPAAPAAAEASGAAAKPAAPAPKTPDKPKAPAKPATPDKMIPAPLKEFLEGHLASGEYVTLAVGKDDEFTGRIFRLMLEEGWIAVEHEDGRRRAFYVITGGRVTGPDGEFPLPS